jgi:hypothetical protein
MSRSAIPISTGPAQDCVVDKIEEFEERIVALKFLLHFVGDLHQPLHSSDDNDRGGNDKRVTAHGFKAGNLHHFWDTEFVDQLGADARSIASDLIGQISQAQEKDWSHGTLVDWGKESFQIGRNNAYGQLPTPNARHSYLLRPPSCPPRPRCLGVALKPHCSQRQLVHPPTLRSNPPHRPLYHITAAGFCRVPAAPTHPSRARAGARPPQAEPPTGTAHRTTSGTLSPTGSPAPAPFRVLRAPG